MPTMWKPWPLPGWHWAYDLRIPGNVPAVTGARQAFGTRDRSFCLIKGGGFASNKKASADVTGFLLLAFYF